MRKQKADRQSLRAPVVPEEIRGILTVVSGEEQMPFLIWDISEHGVGIVTSAPIDDKAKIRMTLGQPFPLVLDGTIRWCEENNDGDGRYRCGINITTEDSKFRALYNYFRKLWEKGSEKTPA